MAALRCRPGLHVGLWVLLLAAGCVSKGTPPVAEHSPVFEVPAQHVVRRGETLYSIAWRYGLDHRELARRNAIVAPFRILPGQRLRLTGAAVAAAPAAPAAPKVVPSSPPANTPVTPTAASQATGWTWPVQASRSREFGGASQGIDFLLADGQTIGAAAAGEVVYAGVGLRGFRHFVIVKHDARYLSAYGFDGQLRVAEGQLLKVGEPLADNSSSGGVRTLHFEVRRDGRPIDPAVVISR